MATLVQATPEEGTCVTVRWALQEPSYMHYCCL